MVDPGASPGAPALGLRERKKQRTRWAIQEHALRLFARQGYEATTVEQIAAAAEVSPSTFFRYYPTKDDVVILDEYDPMIIEAMLSAPEGSTVVEIMRYVLVSVFEGMAQADLDRILERTRLVFSVPSLRGRVVENMLGTVDLLAGHLAIRTGRTADDPTMRVFAGALIGVWIVAIEDWVAHDGSPPLVEVLDRALVALRDGFAEPPRAIPLPRQ